MYGPVIQGTLVGQRPPSADDAAAIITWFADMEMTRFLTRQTPPSLEEEKENEPSGHAQAAAGYRVVGRYRADGFMDGRWRDQIVTEVLARGLGEGELRIIRDLP